MSDNDHDTRAKAQVDSAGLPSSEPGFHADPLIDRLIEAAIAMGGELWVERERRLLLEEMLVAKGVLAEDELELYVPSDEQRAHREKQREALVTRLLGPLTTLPGNGDS